MRTLLILLVLCAASEPERTPTLLIVPVAQQKAANAACLAISPSAGNTFSARYSTEPDGTVTHYVSSWRMSREELAVFRKAMQVKIAAKAVEVYEKGTITSKDIFTGTTRAKVMELHLKPAIKETIK